ncbi:DUF4192 domain-containing protein [Kitasatospora sp. Ki12]|uniref:DUF4192 domain-containing protein n=1 Tax=Kitasatospora xanthocidica TaxID=83382 RepID=UPI00167BA69C|nr:DUF4192 domain-containing protein [Kitasatospora xanthocidica]GHF74710.1 hypothetical protein GCM10018790_60650 [Kitasatospora xanthocidica]
MNAMNNEHVILSLGPASEHRPVVMRGPADMAELLPYFLGFYPDDSIVAVGLHGPDLRQGGVIRADLPDSPAQWPAAAEETAALLVALAERHGARPLQVLLYLCQDPGAPHAPPVVDGLRPLAADLRAAFGRRGVAVKESLCVSDGRWWSFLCRGTGCCDQAGNPVRRGPDPGPAAAAATVAGLVPRGSRKAILGGLVPIGPPEDAAQREALVRAEAAVGSFSREQGIALLDQAVAEFAAGARELDPDRTARLLLALRDRIVRDRGVEYARPAELAPAERLWRFLARRAVPSYESCAVAPLTLLAWASWVAGDTATARVVLGHVLRLDPDYLLAELLYESLNDGMRPGALLAAVEAQRRRREQHASGSAPDGAPLPADDPSPSDGAAPAAPVPSVTASPTPVGEVPDGGPGRASGARRRRRGGRRKGAPAAPAPAPADPGPGGIPRPSGPDGPAPDGGAPGPVALLPAPARASAPGCARPAGERSARGLRLGRAAGCAPAARSGSGLHRCRGVRRAARGGRRAH